MRLNLLVMVLLGLSLLVVGVFSELTPKCAFRSVDPIDPDTYVVPVIPAEEAIKPDFDIDINTVCDMYTRDSWVCCNETQVEALQFNYQLIKLNFGSCPSCAKSFFRMWCELACSPYQGYFLKIKEMEEDLIHVKTVDWNISSEYAEGLWEACLDTKLGDAPIKVHTADGIALVKSFEHAATPHSPDYNFFFMNKRDDMSAMYVETEPCSVGCNCESCDKSCNGTVVHPPYKGCTIFSLGCTLFGFVAAGSVIGLSIIVIIVAVALRMRHNASETAPLLQNDKTRTVN